MARPPAGIETYKAERLLWQSALQQQGLTIRCPTKTKTMQLIQRLHVFRSLDRNNSYEKTYSIFDDYIIRHPDTLTIVIELRTMLNDLVITTPDGTPADLDSARIAIDALDAAKSEQWMRQSGLYKESEIIAAHKQPTLDEERARERQANKKQVDPDKPLGLE